MKKNLVALCALLAIGAAAHAQDTNVNSGSTSGSNSGATSGSSSALNANNSGNVSATGNENASRSSSASNSGAQSGSMSGAMGNNVTLNQNVPSTQNINQTGSSSSTSSNSNTNTNVMGGGTNNTDNIKYSGTITNATTGGTNSTLTTYDNVHYSGTQTIKNVPGIAMSGPASGPCTGASGSLGLAGPGFGVGLNGAKVDDGCTVRENTRILGQLYQSLASDNPAKMEAQAALLEGMAIIRNMNAKIGGDYQAKPVQQASAPAPAAPAVTQATPATVAVAPGEPTDPYVRARMGLK
jgi:hypothetical protein